MTEVKSISNSIVNLPYSSNRQKGFSIIELMVSILISLIILAGVIQVVINTKVAFLDQEEMSYIQENARYALDVIGRDVLKAGDWGCAGSSPLASVVAKGKTNDADAAELIGVTPFKGYKVVSPTNQTAHFPSTNVSDLWEIKDANGIVTDRPDSYSQSNCSVAIKPSTSSSQSQNCSTQSVVDGVAPINPYMPGATVMNYYARAYFVAESEVMPGQPALKRMVLEKDGSVGVEEVALGLEDMSMLYGVAVGNNTVLRTAEEVEAAAAWADVISVQVNLLFRSKTEMLSTAETHQFLDNTYSDKYYREQITSTFMLRNRT